MSTSEPTLADLAFSAADVERLAADAATESHPAMARARRRIEKELRDCDWKVVRRVLIGKLGELFDDPLSKPLVQAWTRFDELIEQAGRHPPDEESLMPLLEHTVDAKLAPQLVVHANGREVARFDVAATFALRVEGVHLAVRNRRIVKVLSGTCRASVTIALEGSTFYRKESETLKLPGRIDLGEGAAILPG